MDNEQLLKRGICPKCYRPLYESKYTDKILCDCEITTQPMDNTDKLKEIRYNNRVVKHLDKLLEWKDINEGQYCIFHTDLIETIDKTLEYGKQLGREEVIEGVRKWSERRLKNYIVDDARKNEHLNLWHKLNQLKEQK